MKKKSERLPVARIEASADKGLTLSEVSERSEKGYNNIVTDVNQKSPVGIILGNLFTFFNTILFSIAALFIIMIIYFNAIGRSDIVGEYFGISKFIFVLPALMNVTMGSAQELHSLNVIKKLRIVTSTKTRVVRDGNVEKIDAADVVIDDVVVLGAGDQATADLTVIEGEISVDESMLTGESDYIKKLPGDTILSGRRRYVRGKAFEKGQGRGTAQIRADDDHNENNEDIVRAARICPRRRYNNAGDKDLSDRHRRIRMGKRT